MPANPTPAEGVVVPLEATMTMQNAAWGALAKQGFAIEDVEVQPIYLAMLAARPAAPTQSAAQTGEVDWQDRAEGLEADLRSAVQVAWRRGAKEWARLNYPQLVEWLEASDAFSQTEPSQ